ncbi:MAG: hypothetical protein AUJ85_10115 [Elusimicrobia bacterium CG1_02_37_114]|nr:MAG: hypothetical protein AUJ85_10115 [Elusimicrobia bacterium CG1_02_37_114]
MRGRENMPTTMTIPKRLTHGEELVVLTKKEYEDAIQKNKEILEVLKIIAQGEKEYRQGKTKPIHSLSDLDK